MGKRHHPAVSIHSYDEVLEVLEQESETPRHIISIGEPGSALPNGFDRCEHRLRLEFHDIDDEEIGPSATDVWKTIEFAKQIKNEKGTVLVHCHAGISRSSAAALTMLCVWYGQGFESLALSKVLKIRPSAYPNKLFVRHADRLLFSDGTLLDVLEMRF